MRHNRPSRQPKAALQGKVRPVWLFDLDNTLHHASHAIFGEINRLMTAYVAKVLDCDEATANTLRVAYWQRYGATVLGLVKHHGVRSADFLAAAHDFADLPSLLRAERGLARVFRALPGRKILLTNAPQEYSTQVLRHLRLRSRFAKHIAVEQMWVHGRLRPKPDRLMLQRLLARERIAPHRAVLVEDTLGNLKSYHRMGLRTVWVTGFSHDMPHPVRAGRPSYVDLKVQSVTQLGKLCISRRVLAAHGSEWDTRRFLQPIAGYWQENQRSRPSESV